MATMSTRADAPDILMCENIEIATKIILLLNVIHRSRNHIIKLHLVNIEASHRCLV